MTDMQPMQRRNPAGGSSQILFDLCLILFLLGYAYTVLESSMSERLFSNSDLLYFTFTTCLSIGGILVAVHKKQPFFVVVFFFNYYFLSLAPMRQIAIGFDPIFDNDLVLWKAMLTSTLYQLVFFAVVLLSPRKKNMTTVVTVELNRWGLPAVAFLVGAGLFTEFLFLGANLFSSRETSNLEASDFPLFVSVIIWLVVVPFCCFGTMLGLYASYAVGQRRLFTVFVLLTIALAVIINPFWMARYQYGALLFFCMFFWFGRLRPRLLAFMLFLGIHASPLFQYFRYANPKGNEVAVSDFLEKMDYDAFSILCHTLVYTDYRGVSFGGNVVSAVAFFVPRAIWPGKLEPTPYYMMDSLKAYRGLWSHNLAEPLMAEGYFAFGFIGVAVLSGLCAGALIWLEKKMATNRLAVSYVFGCVLPLLLLILLRGPLIVGLSSIGGYGAASYLSVLVLKRRSDSASAPIGID